jgi:VanZ family protein
MQSLSNKYKYFALIYTIATVLWMVFIFCMSAEPADSSQLMSYHVGRMIGGLFIPGFHGWTAERQLIYAKSIDHFVRKGAHMTEYAILAMLVRAAVYNRRERKRSYRWCAERAVLVCAAYACTDEFHQLFVAGRAGQVRDVLIDTAGALIGLIAAGVVLRLFSKIFYRAVVRSSG